MSGLTDQTQIDALGEQLRAKITSKFTASTFVGGFALTVVAAQVSLFWQAQTLGRPFEVSVFLSTAACVVFFHAVGALDDLTMPKHFWEERDQSSPPGLTEEQKQKLRRLTEDDLWALRDRMKFVWMRLTLVATVATAVAVLLLFVRTEGDTPTPKESAAILFGIGAVLVGFVYGSGVRSAAERRWPTLRAKD
jgi:UDP-N-acetylmuramyl pentapeptide phosphotransferase/UDP-N-acetylglucosamine-1-phosphate transferase